MYIPDILFETEEEASNILMTMNEIIEAYGNVTECDLYDLVGRNNSYRMYKNIWTNLTEAKIMKTERGYELSLPCPIKGKYTWE